MVLIGTSWKCPGGSPSEPTRIAARRERRAVDLGEAAAAHVHAPRDLDRHVVAHERERVLSVDVLDHVVLRVQLAVAERGDEPVLHRARVVLPARDQPPELRLAREIGGQIGIGHVIDHAEPVVAGEREQAHAIARRGDPRQRELTVVVALAAS